MGNVEKSCEVEISPEGDHSTKTSEPRSKLKNDMVELRTATMPDGSVEGRIIDIYPNDGNVCVHIALPNGDTITKEFNKPSQATEDYAFVRFCRHNGASIDTFDELLIGSTITVHLECEDWVVKAPYSTYTKRMRNAFPSLSSVTGDGEKSNITAGDAVLTALLFPIWYVFGAVQFFRITTVDADYGQFDMGLFYGATIMFVTLMALFYVL